MLFARFETENVMGDSQHQIRRNESARANAYKLVLVFEEKSSYEPMRGFSNIFRVDFGRSLYSIAHLIIVHFCPLVLISPLFDLSVLGLEGTIVLHLASMYLLSCLRFTELYQAKFYFMKRQCLGSFTLVKLGLVFHYAVRTTLTLGGLP